MRYGFRGPAETICTACAAATHAIGAAARQIAWGRCDAVVTGGAESAATITAVAGFANMTALSTSGESKPFDATRDGFVFGEGAAVFVLERYDLAVARGATILGEILGAASNADAHHITAPAEDGAVKARVRSNTFADHFSQANLFWRSQSDVEKQQIIDAYSFELSKVQDPAIRSRVVGGVAYSGSDNVGIFPYSSVSPFGFNGASYYGKVSWKF